jgi:radical SAM-linked protein
VVARAPLEADAGQREQLAAWDRALRESGLPVVGLDAVPPRPRFVLAAPLAPTLSGEAELVELWLTERLPAWRVREAVERSLPAGHRLREAYDVWLGAPALAGQVVASVYRVRLVRAGADPGALEHACASLLAAPSIERVRVRGGGTVRYDLRPFIEALEVDGDADADPTTLRMTLRHDPERGIGRPDEVLAALGERVGDGGRLAVDALVRERLVLAPPPAAAPPTSRPRGPRRGGGPTGVPTRTMT